MRWIGAPDGGVTNGKAARRATVFVGVTCGVKRASETVPVCAPWTGDDEIVEVKLAPTFPPIVVGS
jgi:hypothetical protein